MGNYLHLTAVGNVGSDAPDFKYTQSGVPVATFRMAVTVRKDVTRWMRVTAWRELAETVNQYVKPGDLVLIECDDAEAKAYLGGGIPKSSQEVTARRVVFLQSKQRQDTQPEPQYAGFDDGSDQLGDIPF